MTHSAQTTPWPLSLVPRSMRSLTCTSVSQAGREGGCHHHLTVQLRMQPLVPDTFHKIYSRARKCRRCCLTNFRLHRRCYEVHFTVVSNREQALPARSRLTSASSAPNSFGQLLWIGSGNGHPRELRRGRENTSSFTLCGKKFFGAGTMQ